MTFEISLFSQSYFICFGVSFLKESRICLYTRDVLFKKTLAGISDDISALSSTRRSTLFAPTEKPNRNGSKKMEIKFTATLTQIKMVFTTSFI